MTYAQRLPPSRSFRLELGDDAAQQRLDSTASKALYLKRIRLVSARLLRIEVNTRIDVLAQGSTLKSYLALLCVARRGSLP